MVLDGALRVIDRDGLDGLSMRRIADDLGVGVMTLYGYVRTKEEIVEGVIARALHPLAIDVDADLPWDEQLLSALTDLHRTFREHPGALQVAMAPHSMSARAVNQIREALLAVVRKAGFSNIDGVEAIADLVAYVVGFTVMQAQRERLQTAAEQGVDLRALPADEFPHLRDAAEAWATRASEHAFGRGLGYLIDGFRQSLVSTERAPSRRTTKRTVRSPRT
jgi:AcrR family transcriptional regulator